MPFWGGHCLSAGKGGSMANSLRVGPVGACIPERPSPPSHLRDRSPGLPGGKDSSPCKAVISKWTHLTL